MQTMIVVLNPSKMPNPTTDLAYTLPAAIEKISQKAIEGNGYEYIQQGREDLMAIWFETESAEQNWNVVLELFQSQKILGNDLCQCSEIYISEQEQADLQDSTKGYPL